MQTMTKPNPAPAQWQDGAPPHVPAAAVEVDRQVCRALRCEECGRGGLHFRPQHVGARYRILTACPACGHENEM